MHRRVGRWALGLVVTSGLALAGCGDGDDASAVVALSADAQVDSAAPLASEAGSDARSDQMASPEAEADGGAGDGAMDGTKGDGSPSDDGGGDGAEVAPIRDGESPG
jgi:hypothetical protein